MMARRGLIGLFLGGASALLLSGCDLFLPRRAFRLRMTVEVATPLGVKTGSSVIEMVAETRVPLGTNSMSRYSGGLSRGEAAVVELSGGPLFVLLKDGDGSNNYSGQLWHALNGGADLDNDDVMAFVAKMGGGDYKAELPRAEWPMMVRFRDLNDPKSVERVDPAAAGVRRILLETTEDAVTVGIEKRLPSYGTKSGFDAWYATLSMDDPRRFTLDDFRKGI
jgi:hypothetical protein